jgi:hypothetical protein
VFDWKAYFKETFGYDVDDVAAVMKESERVSKELEEES